MCVYRPQSIVIGPILAPPRSESLPYIPRSTLRDGPTNAEAQKEYPLHFVRARTRIILSEKGGSKSHPIAQAAYRRHLCSIYTIETELAVSADQGRLSPLFGRISSPTGYEPRIFFFNVKVARFSCIRPKLLPRRLRPWGLLLWTRWCLVWARWLLEWTPGYLL